MKLFKLILLLIATAQLYGQQNIIVLGIAQDGGFPHIGCQKECQLAHADPSLSRYVVSLALVDHDQKKWWLFEATPDMDQQLQYFQEITENSFPYLPEGIFITHAHIGHYTGLMHLGREALGTKQVKVYTLPKMGDFIASNGPWSQLVSLGNIELIELPKDKDFRLSPEMSLVTFQVPHRDEFSETAGFRISTLGSSYLFIPDIDKWHKWDQSIVEKVKMVDHAFLDAAFLRDGEIPNRPMSEIPHPFVEETMALFDQESALTKQKIIFIHLNHTNPLLFDEQAQSNVRSRGFRIAEQGKTY